MILGSVLQSFLFNKKYRTSGGVLGFFLNPLPITHKMEWMTRRREHENMSEDRSQGRDGARARRHAARNHRGAFP